MGVAIRGTEAFMNSRLANMVIDPDHVCVDTRFSRNCPAPAIYFDRRYDPRSPGLFGPDVALGGCMGKYLPWGSLVWHDRFVKPELGDVVLAEIYTRSGPERFGKVLDRIAGKLWLLSEEPPMPVLKSHCAIVATLVARYVTFDRDPGPYRADPEMRNNWLRFARPMLEAYVHGQRCAPDSSRNRGAPKGDAGQPGLLRGISRRLPSIESARTA